MQGKLYKGVLSTYCESLDLDERDVEFRRVTADGTLLGEGDKVMVAHCSAEKKGDLRIINVYATAVLTVPLRLQFLAQSGKNVKMSIALRTTEPMLARLTKEITSSGNKDLLAEKAAKWGFSFDGEDLKAGETYSALLARGVLDDDAPEEGFMFDVRVRLRAPAALARAATSHPHPCTRMRTPPPPPAPVPWQVRVLERRK